MDAYCLFIFEMLSRYAETLYCLCGHTECTASEVISPISLHDLTGPLPSNILQSSSNAPDIVAWAGSGLDVFASKMSCEVQRTYGLAQHKIDHLRLSGVSFKVINDPSLVTT